MSSSNVTSTIDTVLAIANVLGTLASFAFPASATVASIVKIATMVGTGVQKAEPSAVALLDEINAVQAGSKAPTAAQWAAWDAAADKASADVDAAADRVINKG